MTNRKLQIISNDQNTNSKQITKTEIQNPKLILVMVYIFHFSVIWSLLPYLLTDISATKTQSYKEQMNHFTKVTFSKSQKSRIHKKSELQF
jgi:hypothetical protein